VGNHEVATNGKMGMHIEFWLGNLLENICLEGRKGYRRIRLRLMLGKQVVESKGNETGIRSWPVWGLLLVV
jgi:hypothetical protein